MILKSFWSAITAVLIGILILFTPSPAFAALTGINSSSPSATLPPLSAKETKNLPGFKNDSDKPVTVKIQVEGKWKLVPAGSSPGYDIDIDGNGVAVKYEPMKFSGMKPGALVGEVRDAQGNLKAIISGKEQSIELQPKETVTFIVNDDPAIYGNNSGEAKINYSVVAPCATPVPIIPTPAPVIPTPAPVIPTPVPQKLGCNLDGANSNPEFFENVVYKSFEGDSPFRSLVSSSNPLTSSFSFSGSNNSSSEWFELEKFEGPKFENNTIGVKYRPNEIVKTSTDPTYWDSVDADDGNIDGASRSQGRFVLQKDGDIKFEFDNKRGLPTDVGLVWTDIHANAPKMDGYITFEPFDATGKSLGARGPIYVGGDGKTAANPEDDRFFGVHYNGGISAFNVKSTVVQVGVEYDHLQYGRKCRD